jgi:putative phosphoesterase
MIKIIALSDTHLDDGEIPSAVAALVKNADIILHAGDFVSCKAYAAFAKFPRLEAVRGNSDSINLKRLLPERKTIEVDGLKIGLVHKAAHTLGPGVEMLAREMEVDVLVFGHLHRPYVEKIDKLLICPGSPTSPRMSLPTAAEIVVNDGKVDCRILPLGEPMCDYIKYAQSLAKKEL